MNRFTLSSLLLLAADSGRRVRAPSVVSAPTSSPGSAPASVPTSARVQPIAPADFHHAALAHPPRIAKAADVARWLSEHSVVLIDVRSKESFARGHLRGAINLPATELTDEALKRTVPSTESRLVLYCDDNL